MEKTLWEAIDAARAAEAEFRLGHLWGRRLDARAHARDRQAHPGRDGADAGRASDLRRARRAPRSTPSSRSYRDGRRAPHRGAARRSARRHRRRVTRRIPAATPTPPIWSPASSASAISRCRSRPIRNSIPTAPTRRGRYRHAARPRSMPARRAPSRSSSSRTISISAISTACARAASTVPIVPGILPVQNFKQTKSFAARCRRLRAGLARRALRRPRRRRRHAQADRRRGRRRAGARPRRSRRHRFPFLHHEPRRSRLRGLPPARPAPGAASSRATKSGGGRAAR